MSTAIEVREVADRRERKLFLRLPWQIYAGDPNWVPPLLSAVSKTLDPARHPFFEHAEARLYLAWRDGRPAGRIAAIVNHLYNNTHGESVGFWGFFETERDPAVAQALLDRAAADLRERGMTEMRGPFSPSINAESGLLIEGFDRPPVLLMPYNPPWYPELVEGAGLHKLKDLFAYLLVDDQTRPDQKTVQRLERIGKAVLRRSPDLRIRTLDVAHYEEDVARLGGLFNAARRDNWGYVPETDAELRLMARDMKPIVVPDLVLIAELKGEPVGCVISLPDINPVLQKCNGRLLPFGWLRLLLARRTVRGLRILGSAVLPEHRNLGILPLLFMQYVRNGMARGYRIAELSWINEDNVGSLNTLEHAFQPRLYKRYRVYGREL